MGMRRDARRHDTVAVRRQAVVSEDYAEYRQGDRVITIDGPGRVVAVHDGPFPGAEEYEIRLEGGLGGGTYDAGQITASAPVEASVGQSEAAGIHLASDDYPELGTLLHDRPDPASLTYTASLEYQDGPDGGLSLTPAAPIVDDDGEGQVMRDMGEYHSDPLGIDTRLAAQAFDDYHDDHPDDGAHEDGEFDEGDLCGVGHEGPCPDPDDLPPPSNRHTAMPSKYHPRPDGFHTEVHNEFHPDDRLHSWHHRKLVGYLGGQPVGSIDFHLHPRGEALKVNMLHTFGGPEVKGRGVASAMMDDLYAKHPSAWINHGWRTSDGLRWWKSYEEPEGHEHRNVHNVHPEKGWNNYFTPSEVAADIDRNEGNDPGHHSREHPVVDEWRHQPWEHHGEEYDHDLQENRSEDSEGEDKEYCDHCDDYTNHSTYEHEEMDHQDDDEEPDHDPDPREVPLHHGTSLYLTPDDHAFVHNPTLPEKDRAHRLLDIMGRGNMPHGPWHRSPSEATERAWRVADNLPPGGTRRPATHVIFHAKPFEHDEVHESTSDGDEVPQFDTDGRSAHFQTLDSPVNFHLHGLSWGASGGRRSNHTFAEPEPVGMPLTHDPTRGGMSLREDRADIRRKHEERYRTPDRGPLNPPGTGEQMKLFTSTGRFPHQRQSSLPQIHAADAGDAWSKRLRELHEQAGGDRAKFRALARQESEKARQRAERRKEFERGFGEELKAPGGYHPAWGGAAAPDPYGRLMSSEEAVSQDVEDARHDELPIHRLNMLVTAATDPSFRFHVTAAWKDVQAKAKRIRSQGGVSIKYSDGMTVVADVKGDHNVYETALQRAPGRRQSVAMYACGCKWGAYHWGAADDLSRFAGRMCSHALALQYEAASRGMFGRDVKADDTRPRWVPSKVVVKYDIDEGRHIRRSASVPEQPPLLVALASLDDGDPAAHVVTAAVNDLFGDTSGYTEPSLMDPAGPTAPWNPDESPASAGPLSGGEPHNWGSITGPQMLPRLAQALTAEAFWQAIVPLVRTVAPKVIEKAVTGHPPGSPQETVVPDGTENGAQALLHDEPEGALPETDGEEHTASLGDVDLVNEHSLWSVNPDALSPEDPSMQTQGTADQDAADVVAEFQRSAAAKSLMDGGPKDKSGSDIARAAQEYLAKTAASSFSRAEQDALIHESPGVQASNTDRLDIAGTHYAELEARDDEEDDALWLM